MSSPSDEFSLISSYFKGRGAQPDSTVALGIGDDCAVITPPAGHQLCVSIDTMVEGVHFPRRLAAELIAARAMGAAVSDLAAVAARPSHFTLGLTLPEANHHWLDAFSRGLHECASEWNLTLVGGDTTRGPLTISIQVHGWVKTGRFLGRHGAQAGDLVAVTGTLGDAGAGLALIQNQVAEPEPPPAATANTDEHFLLNRYLRPQPRIEAGQLLGNFASSAIDISDGLLADAGHLIESGDFGIGIALDQLPLSSALLNQFKDKALSLALGAGDDYELLFTIGKDSWQELRRTHPELAVTVIGEVLQQPGLWAMQDDVVGKALEPKGFVHF